MQLSYNLSLSACQSTAMKTHFAWYHPFRWNMAIMVLHQGRWVFGTWLCAIITNYRLEPKNLKIDLEVSDRRFLFLKMKPFTWTCCTGRSSVHMKIVHGINACRHASFQVFTGFYRCHIFKKPFLSSRTSISNRLVPILRKSKSDLTRFILDCTDFNIFYS